MVQAPHCPWSQPFLGPVSPRRSRSASRSIVRVSMTRRCSVPFTQRVISMSIVYVPPLMVFCLWIAGTDRCFALFKSMNGMRRRVALRFDLFNASNLLLQRGHVLLHFLHALFQETLVFFKDDTAFGYSSDTLTAQLGKAHHLDTKHACIP